jgi:hypothetical protein
MAMSARIYRFAAIVLAVLIGGLTTSSTAFAIEKYQFMKATENRVWRLNKENGEISVCTLQGERLICTTSNAAATPPPRSYAEIKAAEQAAKAQAMTRREKREEKEMQMMDRIFAFFREMVAMSKDQETAK